MSNEQDSLILSSERENKINICYDSNGIDDSPDGAAASHGYRYQFTISW